MSCKKYLHNRRPSISAAFELTEADFEMQEENEYQNYYRWENDFDEYDYWDGVLTDINNEKIVADILGDALPIYEVLKQRSDFEVNYSFGGIITLVDGQFNLIYQISKDMDGKIDITYPVVKSFKIYKKADFETNSWLYGNGVSCDEDIPESKLFDTIEEMLTFLYDHYKMIKKRYKKALIESISSAEDDE